MRANNSKRGGYDGYEFVWLRITVVVASLGLCAGKLLVWLHI